MLIDPERLRWSRPLKGQYVWTRTPPVNVGAAPRLPQLIGLGAAEDFGVDLGDEGYLVEVDELRRTGESEQEYEARMDREHEARLDNAGPRSEHRNYTPGNIQNLFRRFALTEPTRDGILGFAETYGELGFGVHYPSLGYEPLTFWLGQILMMRRAFMFWSAIKREDEAELRSLVERFDRGVPDTPIRGTVPRAWVKLELDLNVGLSLYKLEPDIGPRADAAGLELRFAPESLISLLWLQFAGVVTAGTRWNVCQYCGEPFEVRRKGQKACSESHRQMAYRKRKQAKK